MLTAHAPDPDAIQSVSPAVLDYIARAEALAEIAPEPVLQLSYGADRGQRIDVYAPAGASGLPVLLFFHGGYWISGHLGWLRFMSAAALRHGFVFVAGTYRLAPRCRWPAQLDDVADAIRFVAANASAWGGDPAQIVTGGHSAGGQLTALSALTRTGPRIAGCAPVSGLFDLRFAGAPIDGERGRIYKYLLADPADDAGASPILFLNRADVRFHLMWGEHDLADAVASGRAMRAQLQAMGGDVTWAELPEASHFDAHLSLAEDTSAWWSAVRAMLD